MKSACVRREIVVLLEVQILQQYFSFVTSAYRTRHSQLHFKKKKAQTVTNKLPIIKAKSNQTKTEFPRRKREKKEEEEKKRA